ncbi:respiratory nitrate reductase subunit gamma [Geobacter hydrogenophilus]|uniref:Nitrate reductase subunit gamma n=1 Tax=Geobacter hydrogenophilus TaxID=40983 RepID=A0A9W6G0Y2_9BACT|nr:respiratory nitrate reductase subunit gamma [Geobacter hydrogenophilus]MBT0894341.1 respiratory nitrate reductase subunit gamma [Geobacter hydrogenophilus]GLI38372.1 nitrate reductase subunit gamma [Geobacter hydrogenophilus]
MLNTVLNTFIFVALPYVALAMLIVVTPYRYYSNRLTWSAYSTQFLERKTLFWGANPWHYGIIPIILAHGLGVVAPGAMKSLLGNVEVLVFLESVGLGLGLFALFGCVVLLLRRVNAPMLKRVTYPADWVLLILLTFQTATGVYISLFMRWGSQWYLHTAVPYLYSLLYFNPKVEYLADFPLILKLHAAGAFLIVALLPFTKLVHLLYWPLDFLKDPPILYRWRSRPEGKVE